MIELIWNGIIVNLLFFAVTYRLNVKVFKFDKNFFLIIASYHLILTFCYTLIFKNAPADFRTYLSIGEININYYGSLISSELVHNFIASLKFITYLNDTNIIVLFSLISLFGILFFVKNLIKIGLKKEFAYILSFIPDLHFWTSVPGKDSLIIFLLSFFFYLYIHKYIWKSYLILFLALLVRPHIGIIFFISILLTEFIFAKNNKKFFVVFFSCIIIILLNEIKVTNYFFLEDGSFADLSRSLNLIIMKYVNSDSAYVSSNFVINIINYIFFPLEFLFDQKSFTINLSIMMQFFTILIVINFIFIEKSKIKFDNKVFIFLIFLNLIYLSILPQLLFNYGLNIRQKWMIIPFFVYFLLFLKNFGFNRKNI